MKKVAMIIPENNFRDEELFQPKEIFERNGIEVQIVSTSLIEAGGMLGAKVKPDILVRDIKIKDFDAVIFVGGSGAEQYWNDSLAQKLAQDVVRDNRALGAICIAPVTLANAGVLKGKRATVWPSEGKQLEAKGAIYTGKPVEKDGNIITATDPSVARQFAEEILKALLGTGVKR